MYFVPGISTSKNLFKERIMMMIIITLIIINLKPPPTFNLPKKSVSNKNGIYVLSP